jgi:two-component system CheB/CheR fusion protein
MRLLLVDDDIDACTTLAEILESLGHEVRTAHDGASAIDLATAFVPEVVLCDIGLPDLDGYQVARRLRAQPVTSAARLIALTGYGQDSDRKNAERAGFDLHLAKPIRLETLTAALGTPR